ncbi:MAG TPA: DUF2188 domain-containing protein [Solirubrobacteraceae bacterium]|nr:DUF2188 domain-containing protein [Solirubrobacteraceae bacterium]
MPDVTIHPHGDRWAVAPAGAASPAGEFATREEAELEARALAQGGTVDVLDRDPTGLQERGGDDGPATGAERPGKAPLDGTTMPDHPRVEQGGL